MTEQAKHTPERPADSIGWAKARIITLRACVSTLDLDQHTRDKYEAEAAHLSNLVGWPESDKLREVCGELVEALDELVCIDDNGCYPNDADLARVRAALARARELGVGK
ncbi:MAG: hypothetical protein ACIAQU_04245 [Phycisphaerales bacterium JB064]